MWLFRYIKQRVWLSRPEGSYAETFAEEMHFQASRVLIFAAMGAFLWLNYLSIDQQLHPDLPAIVWLRIGLPVVGIITLVLMQIDFFRVRSQWVLFLFSSYLFWATAIITGLTGGDPTYVSGFIFILSLLVMAPLEKRYSYPLLYISMASYLITGSLNDMDFGSVRARYMLNDLLATTFTVSFFIFVLDKIRFSNWQNARKIAIDASRKIKEAEAENKAKGQFLAAMSHEIRTPMNGVIGMAQLLQTTELQPQQRQYVEVIAGSGTALLNIINDILDYSKIEAGKMDLEQIDFDLDKLCLDVVSIFSVQADRQQLHLLSSIAPGTPLFINTDPTRLRQILLNLLGNAFKFTSKGRVSLRVSLLAEASDANTHCLKFEVKDSGIGMSPEQMGNLFRAFQQADVSTARKYGGTGLGLSICRSLAQLMGGDIGVNSEVGSGSTFWFTIRCQSATPAFVAAHALPVAALNQCKLLVVEGDAAYAKLIAEQGNAWGMLVDIVPADQAVIQLKTADTAGLGYDLVMVELPLTGTDMLALSAEIAATPSLRSCRRILLSTLRYLPSKEQQLAAGIHGVLQKPVSARTLLEGLLAVLGKPAGDAKPQSQHTSADPCLLGRQVLIAEDNTVNQLVIRSMLKKMGVESVFANDGHAALARYQASPQQFDLVFMDCEMPDMDGFECTRAIRQWEQEKGLPHKTIIALTAHAMKEHRDLCARAGMDDHLSKPLELELLQQKLVSHLQH